MSTHNQQQFESACEHLQSFLESENSRISLSPRAVGTVFLLQGLDKERAQDLLKQVFKWNQEADRPVEEYIQRGESNEIGIVYFRTRLFKKACEDLDSFLESENSSVSLSPSAVGIVFLMLGVDKERAQDLLKQVYFKWNQQADSPMEEYIQRGESNENR